MLYFPGRLSYKVRAFLLEFTTSVVLSLCVWDITVMNSNGRCAFRTTLYSKKEEFNLLYAIRQPKVSPFFKIRDCIVFTVL